MTTADDPAVELSDYQQSVAAYWDRTATGDEQNVRLGEIDGYYHHHYGIGEVDTGKLVSADSEAERDRRVIAELHRLEHAQADYLLDQFGWVADPSGRVLDAGCGRGGTSFVAHERFGGRVDGVSISQYQVGFANMQAVERGCAEQVQFHVRDMVRTGFEAGEFSGVWTNETSMYVDLDELFAECARLLEPGGRYVCVTGAHNDTGSCGQSDAVQRINDRYQCSVHARSAYFAALARQGLVPIKVEDLTPLTLPYWRLRQRSSIRTGVEDDFLEAYEEDSFHYLLIVADRV